MRLVKLQVHQIEGNKTYVENFDAEEFDTFILIRIDPALFEEDEAAFIREKIAEIFNDKQVLIIPNNVTFEFYGLREEEENNDG